MSVVDAEGLDALSMPRLARELEAGVMTLYRYVQSKQELLDAVTMRAIAEIRILDEDRADGGGTLVAWGRGLRRVLRSHPGVATVLARRGVIGEGIFRGVESLLARLADEGFRNETALRAVYAVIIYTLGFAIWEAAREGEEPDGAYAARWQEGFARLPPGQFPHSAAGLATLGTVASQGQFEFGLQALVKGLLDARTEGDNPASEP